MEYPSEFSSRSRSLIEAENHRLQELDAERQKVSWQSEQEVLVVCCILQIFLAFAKEACGIRLWDVDKIDKESMEFLRLSTIETRYKKGNAVGKHWINNWNGFLSQEIEQQFRASS